MIQAYYDNHAADDVASDVGTVDVRGEVKEI